MKFNHILAKHGVLNAFNISKKIKPAVVRKLRNELKKTCGSEAEINERLQKMILLRLKNAVHFDEIPGLILKNKTKNIQVTDPFEKISDVVKQKIVGIVLQTNSLFKQEKFDKELILIFMQIMLLENKITNDDIVKFNEKYKLTPLSDSDSDDDDDDDSYDDDSDSLV